MSHILLEFILKGGKLLIPNQLRKKAMPRNTISTDFSFFFNCFNGHAKYHYLEKNSPQSDLPNGFRPTVCTGLAKVKYLPSTFSKIR